MNTLPNEYTIKPSKPYDIQTQRGTTRFFDDVGLHYATAEKGIQHTSITFHRRVDFGELQHVYRNIEL